MGVTKAGVRNEVGSGSRLAIDVFIPMSWIRSAESSTGASPGTPSCPAASALRGTSFIPHSGQRAFGSAVTKAGCIGQVYSPPAATGAAAAFGSTFLPHTGQGWAGSAVTSEGWTGQAYSTFAVATEAAGAAGAPVDGAGTRSMPQIGHSPLRCCTMVGCIGQW